MIQQFNSLLDMMETFSDEQVCIDHLTAIRWKDGAFCPHCGSTKNHPHKEFDAWVERTKAIPKEQRRIA